MRRVTRRLESDGVASFAKSFGRCSTRVVAARREAAAARRAHDRRSSARPSARVEAPLASSTRRGVPARLWKQGPDALAGRRRGHAGRASGSAGSTSCDDHARRGRRARAPSPTRSRAAGFTHARPLRHGRLVARPARCCAARSASPRAPRPRAFSTRPIPPPSPRSSAERSGAHALHRLVQVGRHDRGRASSSQYFWARATARARRRTPAQPLRRHHRSRHARSRRCAREHGFRRVFLQPARHRRPLLRRSRLRPRAGGAHGHRRRTAARARARRMLLACGPSRPRRAESRRRLGAIARRRSPRAGRDKLTLRRPTEARRASADWAEQLIAESTGKQGRGIVPVVRRAARRPPAAYGNGPRLRRDLRVGERPSAQPLATLARAGHPVVAIRLNDAYDLGAEFVRWEIATAVAGGICSASIPSTSRTSRRSKGTPSACSLRLGAGVPRPRAGAFGRHRRRRRAPTSGARSPSARPPRLPGAVTPSWRPRHGGNGSCHELRTTLRKRLGARHHARLRPALPAFDRTAPQGRPGHGARPAAHRRRSGRSYPFPARVQLRGAQGGAGAGRPAGARSRVAGRCSASTSMVR